MAAGIKYVIRCTIFFYIIHQLLLCVIYLNGLFAFSVNIFPPNERKRLTLRLKAMFKVSTIIPISFYQQIPPT